MINETRIIIVNTHVLLLIFITCIRYSLRILLFLRNIARVLTAHSWSILLRNPFLDVVCWANLYAIPSSRLIIITKRHFLLIQLICAHVRVFFPAGHASNHHAHQVFSLGCHGCFTLFAMLIAMLAIVAGIQAAELALVFLNLTLSVLAVDQGIIETWGHFLAHPA